MYWGYSNLALSRLNKSCTHPCNVDKQNTYLKYLPTWNYAKENFKRTSKCDELMVSRKNIFYVVKCKMEKMKAVTS